MYTCKWDSKGRVIYSESLYLDWRHPTACCLGFMIIIILCREMHRWATGRRVCVWDPTLLFELGSIFKVLCSFGLCDGLEFSEHLQKHGLINSFLVDQDIYLGTLIKLGSGLNASVNGSNAVPHFQHFSIC